MVGSFSLCYDVMLSVLIKAVAMRPRRASQRPGRAPMGVGRRAKASRSVEHGGIGCETGALEERWVCGDETKRDELRCDGPKFQVQLHQSSLVYLLSRPTSILVLVSSYHPVISLLYAHWQVTVLDSLDPLYWNWNVFVVPFHLLSDWCPILPHNPFLTDISTPVEGHY